MSERFKRYTVTTALPYVNGPLHIGHLAGVYIPADIFVRYLRLKGSDVLFIGGSDEHGVPITIKARQEGVSPTEIINRYHNLIKNSFEQFGISFDIYSRTSLSLHHKTASDFFAKLNNNGQLIVNEVEQYFDEEANEFLADRYIVGTCPHCFYEKAYGDQCEKCGTSLNSIDLINPKSSLTGNTPVLKKTKHWFLPLEKYSSWLENWILEEHKDWKVNVVGQCKSWINQGLQPRAVTRDLDWGVKVPHEDAAGKVLYVWFDAPIGYISAAKDWSEKTGKNWEPYWKSNDTKLLHFIGKDNIVFHCIIFPTMLKAEGSFILPENVPANEFLNLEGNKISTSQNWAVWLHEYLEEFPGKEDLLRYTLSSIIPETKDSDFTWKDFQSKNNNELLAIFGNFVNRTMVLIHKYYNGKVPNMPANVRTDSVDVLNNINSLITEIERSLENFRFREALSYFIDIARQGNKYLTENEPWKKQKLDAEHCTETITVSAQIMAKLAIVSQPFLPFTSKKLSKLLNFYAESWEISKNNILLNQEHEINTPEFLFEKIEDEVIDLQIEKLRRTAIENSSKQDFVPVETKAEISFDDFNKMDLRIATILEAEKVAKTKKLMKLIVDTGIDKRVIISGIADQFEANEIIGKQVLVLINLAPKDLKGYKSHGMILLSEDSSGKLSFVVPESKVKNGLIVK